MTSPQYISTAHIQEIYIGLLGRAADNDGLTYWQTQISNNLLTLEQLRANIVNFQAEYINGLGAMSRAEVVDELYERLFERTPDAEGYAYWVDGPGRHVNVDQLVLALVNGANAADRLVLDNKVEAAEYYTANVTFYNANSAQASVEQVDSSTASVIASKASTDNLGITGYLLNLSEHQDLISGSSNNDTFIALAGANSDGTRSNTLNWGDIIDGKQGQDTLTVSLINETTPNNTQGTEVKSRTINIETIEFEIQESDIQVDASELDSVHYFWSDNSDHTLNLNKVTLGTELVATASISFGLKDTAPLAGLKVAFQEQALSNLDTINSNSSIRIAIANKTDASTSPLANTSFSLTFQANGQQYNLTNIQTVDGTYAGLVSAINQALPSIGLASVSASLGRAFNTPYWDNNPEPLNYTANEIVLSSSSSAAFSNPTLSIHSNATTGLTSYTEAFDPSNEADGITTNLILDNAGRLQTGGDVIIGSEATSQKISSLNLLVDRDSSVGLLATSLGMTDNDGAIGIGNPTSFENITVTSLNNNGNISINEILDANNFNALGFNGDKLSVHGTASGNNAYSYTTGTSKDSISIDINFASDDLSSFTLNTDTQGEADNITYRYQLTAESITELLNAVTPSNVSINSGDGNDSVTLKNTHSNGFIIGTVALGSGNDTITIDSGLQADAIAITTIHAGSGNDEIILNNNMSAGSGYSTIVLQENFGHDRIANFKAGSTASTNDVIDYRGLLVTDTENHSPVNSTQRAEPNITPSFQNLAVDTASITDASIDHNKVITIKFSDLFDEISNHITPGQLLEFTDINANIIELALNNILSDEHFANSNSSEELLVGVKVVFNIAFDKQIVTNGNQISLGQPTALTTMAILTSEVSHDPTAPLEKNLTLTESELHGFLEFSNFNGDITDLESSSVAGTEEYKNQVALYSGNIEQPIEQTLILTGVPSTISSSSESEM